MRFLVIVLISIQLYAEPLLCLIQIEKVQLSVEGMVKSSDPKEIKSLYKAYSGAVRGIQYECPEDSELVQSALDTEAYINVYIEEKGINK